MVINKPPMFILRYKSVNTAAFSGRLFCSGLLRRQKHFYDNAVTRPLRTPTRRSWQPGGFGDSCLPDGIFHGALDYRFVEVMPTPDAVSRSM